ncbi:hypothetical protein ACP4OV_015118 [Aristida adscensionis]
MVSLPVSYAALCGIAMVIGWLIHWVYKWVNPSCKGKLPPGSMGFPIIGETFQFLKASPSIDIPNCYQQRLKRYGPIFKTNLLGQPMIVSMDPELDRFIFQQEGKFVTTHSSTVHKFVRSFASKLFGAANLKEVLMQELEDSMKQRFAEWATKPSIEVDSISEMTSMDPCMKGRRNVRRKLTELLNDRLRNPGKKHGDLLDVLVEELQSDKMVIDPALSIDLLAALLFASFLPPAATLSLALKFLTDNPKVVETLKAILKKREDKNSGFTWEEYKSLTFTTQVMDEVNRIGNIATGIFRKALTDVQVNGYTIPAGWMVLISPTAVHLNPEVFEDPLKFDPWRWMTQDETRQITQKKKLHAIWRRHKALSRGRLQQTFYFTFSARSSDKRQMDRDKRRRSGTHFRYGDSDYHIQLIPTTK